MRRLSPGRPARLSRGRLARLREERGGIAVMLALLMPLLFGAAALGIDMAAVWSARQQVQTGADAAVIAVAMDCARGDCGNIKQTAEDAFWANDEAAKLSNLGPGEGWIRVNGREVSATQKKAWLVNHFFAGALGEDTGELSVSSYAEWAPFTEARSELPFAISYCTYKSHAASLGSKNVVTLGSGTPGGSCYTPQGEHVNGVGINFTRPDSGECGTTTVWKSTYRFQNGSLPSECSQAYISSLVGRDVVIPVWDASHGQDFRVYGYAAFRVTGFSTTGGGRLTGYFTYSARQVDDTTPPPRNAPDLGARAVFLTDK
ncbi:TadE/TadG family type IV pilus assembly protein [Blastococcus tunisiensis]|uniref:Putative Flp pilus-assembly TadE/G-like n=1 Tax=Blastococcus tunisiensis TaxID=1798228 RepID=A0A1I2G9G3_9ACTN|nr:Tad domain-containing protein [Blastococcus sp. DSM 46838]SFF13799.1 Putative Flp pilus-assembly TadE/G-like [Blastococcus sp. DSM 46838]